MGGTTLLDPREESSSLLFSSPLPSHISPHSKIWQRSMFMMSQVFPRTWWDLRMLLDPHISRAVCWQRICLHHKVLTAVLSALCPHSLPPVPSADLWLVGFTVEPETAVAPQPGSSYVHKLQASSFQGSEEPRIRVVFQNQMHSFSSFLAQPVVVLPVVCGGSSKVRLKNPL